MQGDGGGGVDFAGGEERGAGVPAEEVDRVREVPRRFFDIRCLGGGLRGCNDGKVSAMVLEVEGRWEGEGGEYGGRVGVLMVGYLRGRSAGEDARMVLRSSRELGARWWRCPECPSAGTTRRGEGNGFFLYWPSEAHLRGRRP